MLVPVDLLCCPLCRGALPLQAQAPELCCAACGETFPSLAGIPVLLPNARAQLVIWSERLAAFEAETSEAVRQVLAQSVGDKLHPRTRTRLLAVAEGLRGHVARVTELCALAGLHPAREFTSQPGESLSSYYSLIHRDWGWAPEVDEVTPSVEALIAVLPPGFTLGRTLVLGAGTARLAWELGNRIPGASDIIAIDVNPLPFLVTKRLMEGHAVSMLELPGHPRRSTMVCIERNLKAPQVRPPGLQLLLADGLNPPVVNGAFDTVLTPWFVDQVPEDLATLPAMIRRVLRPGGAWLNQGPFVYDPARTKPVHRYCADEFIQIVNANGFAVSKATYLPHMHMASPVSAQGRSEWVLNMHATAVSSGSEGGAEPPWLAAGGAELAIPTFEGLANYVAPHPSVAAVIRLVDGTKSAQEIANRLVAAGELSEVGATEAVQACLRLVRAALSKQS